MSKLEYGVLQQVVHLQAENTMEKEAQTAPARELEIISKEDSSEQNTDPVVVRKPDWLVIWIVCLFLLTALIAWLSGFFSLPA